MVAAQLIDGLVELQSEIILDVKGTQVVLKSDATIFLLIPFERVEHHIAESVFWSYR
jgi:hypothetical protein